MKTEAFAHSYHVPLRATLGRDSQIGGHLIHGGEPLEVAMAAAIALREDYDARGLRRLAKQSDDADQTRRLLALAAIYDGDARGAAAELAGVGLQTVRDWVLRFNAGGPDGLINRKAPGKPPLLNDGQRRELAEVVERGPIPAVDGVVRWRLIDLGQWVYEAYGISASKQALSRTLRGMGYRKLSARPRHHAQHPEAAAIFKKSFPRAWRKSPRRTQLVSR
jgi:transposase